jgi:predicted pyridoxine 5'-phosphate oxidase superfamily flavin-nucleotide-binding protein
MEITDIEGLRDIIYEPSPGLEAKNIPYLDEFACEFIEKSPFIILSTSDADGRCDGSPKGDAPGFVEVVDPHTLLIPDRPGNRLAYGHKNILANPNVAVLFCIPGTTETLRVSGKAFFCGRPRGTG